METIRYRALTADYMTAALLERMARFNNEAGEWERQRNDLETKLETIVARAATAAFGEGANRTDNAVPSWIAANTFPDVAAAVVAADALRRMRLELPITGIRLADDLTALRIAAQKEWGEHVARLQAALEKAEAAALKEAEAFAGLSDAARRAHIADRTQGAREACRVNNPTAETWHGWAPATLSKNRDTLTVELREAFKTSIR